MTNQELAVLVAKAQTGSRQAMNDLIASCYQDLFFYAFKTVQNEDLAADITQDGCMDIIAKISELREPAAFGAWARRIIHTRCTRYFRQTREVTVVEDENGETIFDRLPDESEGVLPEQVQEDKEFRQTMQQMLDSLPAEQRTALLLYYYEKLSVSQIADIQGVSDGTVKSRLNYGRKAVKNKVEEYEKKTGVRLHSLAPLPLLLYFLLAKEKELLLSKCAPVLGGILGTVTATGTAAAGTAAGMGIGMKIAAVIAAIAAAIGLTVGGIAIAQNSSADKPKATPTTVDASVLDSLPEIWYGSEYSDGNESDVMLLPKDGTVVANGITYRITGIEMLNGSVELQYPRSTQLWEQDGPGYRISLTAKEVGTAQLDLLTVPGCPDPVAAFLYVHYQVDGISRLAITGCFSISPPEPAPPLPLELLTGVLGQWEYLPIDNAAYNDSFVLNEDGTLIHQGQTYIADNIRVDEASEMHGETIVLELSCTSDQGYPWLGINFVKLSDGNYAAEMIGLIMGEGNQYINHFYRPSDYTGYRKIMLTEENWQEYIAIGRSFISGTNEETGEYFISVGTSLNLPENAAPISYFYGDVYYTTTYDEILALPDGTRDRISTTPDAISGQLNHTLVLGAQQDLMLWCANPGCIGDTAHKHPFAELEYREFTGTASEGAVMLIPNYEQMWAENVIGCVYLPIN